MLSGTSGHTDKIAKAAEKLCSCLHNLQAIPYWSSGARGADISQRLLRTSRVPSIRPKEHDEAAQVTASVDLRSYLHETRMY